MQIPHPIPYQGSKRSQAAEIVRLIKQHGKVRTLYEPFAGSAAVSIRAAALGIVQNHVLGDTCKPLMGIWEQILQCPERLASEYEALWLGQLESGEDYFNNIRSEFNTGTPKPSFLLYLIARCVKNSVRFNASGNFTQSVDRRRLGTRPEKMKSALVCAGALLRGKAMCFMGDFKQCIDTAGPNDFVYMDPPYQGTTYGRDKRYYGQLRREDLIESLFALNARGVPWLLSYDGHTGTKSYGELLPASLGAERILMHVGRSTQATLNGKNLSTVESLYISPLVARGDVPAEILLGASSAPQLMLEDSLGNQLFG